MAQMVGHSLPTPEICGSNQVVGTFKIFCDEIKIRKKRPELAKFKKSTVLVTSSVTGLD